MIRVLLGLVYLLIALLVLVTCFVNRTPKSDLGPALGTLTLVLVIVSASQSTTREELNYFHLFSLPGLKGVVLALVLVLLNDHESKIMTLRQTEQ